MMKKFVEYVFLTLGASIVALGLETMLAPNGLVDGGVTALSIMANALWGIPIYVVFLGLNIPILIFTAKEVGKTFVIRTLYANIITTAGLVLFKSIPPITKSEVLIVLLLYYEQVSFFQIKKCRFSSRSIRYYGGVLCL